MFLKSIEIMGFKSFPDKIDLIFPKGITCVVGPNGSGKSNISDAIRWVMGEQSVKTLRGGKMEDVIFSGTLKRKPIGFCEVNLSVDNKDRSLPLDFDEILISRRIFRSGESEYFINKSACRLKDIHELFMDTGLGKDGYSIVGQGKIDSIISGKPSERRVFFEEACGISKYHYKKDEAERKLASTNDNLVRINDIIFELEKQLEPLKQQSDKAKKYLVLRDELKELEVNLWAGNYIKLKESSKSIYEEFEASKKEFEDIKGKLENADLNIESLNKKMKELQEENDKLRQENYNFEYNIKTFENQIEIAKNNILHGNEDRKRVQREKQEILKRTSEFENNKSIISENIKNLNEKKSAYESELTALTNKLNLILNNINSHNSHIDALKLKLSEKNNEMLSIKAKKSALDSLIVSYNERIELINNLIKEKKEKLNEFNDAISDIDKNLSELNNSYESINKKISKQKSDIEKTDNLYTKKSEELNLNKNEYIKLNNRISMLKDMENNFSLYPNAVREVLNSKMQDVTVYGTVASLLKTDKNYAAAIDSALLSSANNVVCKNENDAKTLIRYLKSKKAGRVTFMPLSSVKGQDRLKIDLSKEKGFVGIASDLVRFDEKFSLIVYSLLNRVAVFDSFDNAVSVMRKYNHSFKAVTLTGEIFNAGGSITGGEFKNNLGALKVSSEIDEINEKLNEYSKGSKALEKEIDLLKEELNQQHKELQKSEEAAKDINNKKIELLSKLAYEKELIKQAENDLSLSNSEKSSLELKIEESKKSISSFEMETEKIKIEIEDLSSKITEGNSDFDNVISSRDKLNEELSDLKFKISSLSKDISYENDKINAIDNEIEKNKEEIENRELKLNEISERILDIEDEIEFRKGQIDELTASINEYNIKIRDNNNAKEKANSEYEYNLNLSKELREKFVLVSEENSRLEVKVSKIDSDIEQIVNSLWESYEITISEALEMKKNSGKSTSSQKKINELKEKIKGLGNINIDAIEEYKEVNERYTFLTNQRNDLTSAKANLEKIISEMTVLMKDIFRKQFSLIAQSFNDTYIELFGGGRAELSLTEPENILESGIEIEVQPPGKKLTTISLLSGGEKAFTAIALLFSIIKIKPTPFCLFDEIEAALDDVNVYRYAEYLKRFKNNTQFIIITHRRGTMEVADTLYGVTMQEKGVSKLLSLNIDEIEEKGLGK